MYDSKTKKDKCKTGKGVVCQASEQAKDSVGRSDFLLHICTVTDSQQYKNVKIITPMKKQKLMKG